ncbi:MAG: polysaccharide biosynthesis/export family protein [Labilithrix sp.]|nr:polysaccharide biosynthesis/export family protein [Labilithrix sp.]MBX3221823.1 polysaccharide biosynthesis/export family protein [Labilithrix sp.]
MDGRTRARSGWGVLGIATLLALTSVVGCRSSAPPYDYKVEPDPRASEFHVGPLDQLSIVVWKNRELSAEVTVRPDGVITLPLIGDVKAGGRTPSDLQREIAKRLADFVREEDVVVSVGVASVNSYHFTVMGSVERAGLYSSKSYVTVVEAVALAGGPNRFAGDFVYVVRGTPARRVPIDLRRATSSEHADENLVVLAGDLIVVP